jgi:hypothetical protein
MQRPLEVLLKVDQTEVVTVNHIRWYKCQWRKERTNETEIIKLIISLKETCEQEIITLARFKQLEF